MRGMPDKVGVRKLLREVTTMGRKILERSILIRDVEATSDKATLKGGSS